MNVLKTESPELIEQLTVGPAWSGHKVNYSLLTTEVRQYVGYYGADRQLVIAGGISIDWIQRSAGIRTIPFKCSATAPAVFILRQTCMRSP